MSVTGHRDIRLADDQYSTPEWCTRLLLPHLQRGDVLEPCCGKGQIAKVIHETWNEPRSDFMIDGVEIDGEHAQAARDAGYIDRVDTADFLRWYLPDRGKYPLVITNPPFSLALEFVKRSLEVADTVAMLLRLAWLSSQERSAFHRENPSDLIVLPKRPSFAKFVSCSDTSINIDATPDADGSIPFKCGWRQTFKPDEVHPKKCPNCGAKTKASTSDSADYGWFIWGPGRSGRIIHPDITNPADTAKQVNAADREFDGAAAELERLTR